MNWQEHVVSDSNVLLGKPTIKGIRLSVDHIVSLLAKGWNEQQVLENYPRLTQEDIKAVFACIYECMQDGMFVGSSKKTAL
ncbi:MAG: DUF433 domain-containing protein [Chitinophagaceae bacterium]|nr:DUF433 domain-containing protein [Chitinophagaceae bacterium]